MPTAQSNLVTGTITATGSPYNLNLGFLPSYIQYFNYTQLGSTANPGVVKRAQWQSGMGAGTAVVVKNTNGAATDETSLLTTGGFTLYDGAASVLLGASITGTTISKASPAVCTAAAHGLTSGDIVLMSNNVVMKQLGGMYFTVTVTGANTFTIPINTNVANFTAETGFVVRKLQVGPLYYPQRSTIVGITAANPMVISTSAAHGLTVGQKVRIRVPTKFGMVQANNLQAVITAVTSVTLTLGAIDSSAFTAFGWPAAGSIPLSFAEVVPFGSGPTPVTVGGVTYNTDLLDDATLNQQFQGITLGSSVCGAASDVIYYLAARSSI